MHPIFLPAVDSDTPLASAEREALARREQDRAAEAERSAREHRLNQERVIAAALEVLTEDTRPAYLAERYNLPIGTDVHALIAEIRGALSPLVRDQCKTT